MEKKQCVMCDAELVGSQRLFCSEACKQAAKYAQSKGELCKYCKQPMKPAPMLGGYKQDCNRAKCINQRSK